MRIALVLSGQLRSFSEAFEYISQNLLANNEVDVYFHTWCKNWNSAVVNKYKPKDYFVELDNLFGLFSECNYVSISPRHPPRNFFMMYRSIMMADLLRQNSNIEYDWIVRTRFDFALNKKIDFTTLSKNKMYFCNTSMNAEHTAMHDQFVVSTPNDMSIYSSVYKNIDQYYSEGCLMNGEDLLQHHFKKHNMFGKDKIGYLDLNPPFMHGQYNYGKHSLIRTDMQNWL
jgi:hypothetical protein